MPGISLAATSRGDTKQGKANHQSPGFLPCGVLSLGLLQSREHLKNVAGFLLPTERGFSQQQHPFVDLSKLDTSCRC